MLACAPVRTLYPVALALLTIACARNAALEIELTVPAQPAGSPQRYAVVQFETDAEPFESVWQSNADHPGAELTGEPQLIHYTVLSENPDSVVQMKVLFCQTPTCTAIEDAPDRTPAVWYSLERSLYIGARTRWRPVIQAIPSDPPTAPVEVGKCEIEGCIHGGAPGSTFCRLSGEHYCESL